MRVKNRPEPKLIFTTAENYSGVERMSVKIEGLPANTEFDVFVIQVSNAPFGMSWYQDDPYLPRWDMVQFTRGCRKSRLPSRDNAIQWRT